MILILALRILLGFIFLAIGAAKLSGHEHTVAYFAAIGWGQWLRYATGLIDVTAAILLFMPRFASYGAIALTASVGLATLLSFTILYGNPDWSGGPKTMVPLVLTLLCAALSWLARTS